MILQTGMRTDIPAFYSRWFYNRLKEGYCLVRNPYNPSSVTRYRIDPEVVDLIGFCTKNPAPMFDGMAALKPYGQYWFVTITPYGRDIEPLVPAKEKVMEDFKRLSELLGPDCVGWRYDPIFITGKYTLDYHLETFGKMAENLKGTTDTCVISFIDLYGKVLKNFPEVVSVSKTDREIIGRKFAEIASANQMTLRPCGEGRELEKYGADCSGCMTVGTFEKALHARLHVPAFKSARRECACYLAGDIGMYDTCSHGCRYCYANTDMAVVRSNRAAHDPGSPFLIGGSLPGDVIHQAKQKSWIDRQMSIFDYIRTDGE